MTITNQTETARIVLPARPRKRFWQLVRRNYARTNPERWRNLAMLTLYECAFWQYRQIAFAFGETPFRVHRLIERVKREMRMHFDPE